jgi:hypothetical protein
MKFLNRLLDKLMDIGFFLVMLSAAFSITWVTVHLWK